MVFYFPTQTGVLSKIIKPSHRSFGGVLKTFARTGDFFLLKIVFHILKLLLVYAFKKHHMYMYTAIYVQFFLSLTSFMRRFGRFALYLVSVFVQVRTSF